MIDCHGVMKRLWEYVDGELPADQADEIAEHLALCARCHPQYQFQLAFLATVVRSHAHPSTAKPDFAARLRAALVAADPAALS